MTKTRQHTNLIFDFNFQNCCLLIVLLIFGLSGFSQNKSTENQKNVETLVSSISQQLQLPITDSLQIKNNMFRAVELSKESKDKTNLIKSYHNLATWYEGNSTLDSTIYYLDYAAKVSKDSKLSILEAETYLKKERIYNQNGDNENAMAEVLKALKLYEKIDNPLGIAKSYTRLCDLLYYQEKYTEASDYCQKAIDILKRFNVPEELGKSYRFKASNLLMLDENNEALTYINKSIAAFKNAGDNEINLAKNYNTRGNIYKYMERYEDAITDYQNCLDIAKKYNATGGIIAALANIGHVKTLQEKHEESLPYTLEVIDLMKKSGNTLNLRENYMHAARSYETLGDYEKALEYEKLYSDARFEELRQMNSQLASELQIKYESEKKDETIVEQNATIDRQRKIQLLYIGIAVLLGIILFGMYFTLKNIRKKRKALAVLNKELAKKQDDLENSNNKLKQSLEELKATQSQLIQSEKLASLGQLAAGIAHEIKNPLNFVNNFSEINLELIEEINEELAKLSDSPEKEEIKTILGDLMANQNKIYHHGTRADSIVKSMLLHSRGGNGIKEPTDINAMLKEYVNLSFHAMRAGKKAINVSLDFQLDDTIQKPSVIMEDVSRVILNLCNNAFDAMHEKRQHKTASQDYQPKLSIRTYEENKNVIIEIEDNGLGIPATVKDKILMPFFTTKKGTEGTGLGLSITNDIIIAHGGRLLIESRQGEDSFTKFIIKLPI